MKKLKESLWKRFWRKVDINGTDDCWEWTASRTDRGYGQIKVLNKVQRAHRIAFLLSGGVLTEEKPQVLHTCDNPACCNPKHLYAGSIQNNMKDRNERGRTQKGEKSGTARLHNEDVYKIRELYGKVSSKEIAVMFGICRAYVYDIVNRRKWRCLSE
jgi:hypothetical protein